MATDDLTGNMATEDLIKYLQAKKIDVDLNMDKWLDAMTFSSRIFNDN